MPRYLLKYKLEQEFEVDVDADSAEQAKAKAPREFDFVLAACERGADLSFVDFDLISVEEQKENGNAL